MNKILISIISLCSLYIGYIDIIENDIYNLLIVLSIILVILLPTILKKIFKIKISDKSECIYIIFVFLSHFLGSIFNLYDKIFWYDTFMHFLSGIVISFFALELLIRLKKYDKKNILFNIIFIISISFMAASLWEFFEFISDKLFNKDCQKVIETGVDDTMKDMIVAAVGSVLFNITYILKKDNKNSCINKFIEDI